MMIQIFFLTNSMYLIVYQKNYEEQIKPLIKLRNVQDIHCFESSNKNYLQIYQWIWSHKPDKSKRHFVCLVGNEDEVEPIPYTISEKGNIYSSSNKAASDIRYGMSGQKLLAPSGKSSDENVTITFMVGRITSGQTDDIDIKKNNVQNQINKIIQYETNKPQPRIFGIANDESDGSTTDKEYLYQILSSYVEHGYSCTTRDKYDKDIINTISSEFNQSSTLLYIGHGVNNKINTSGFSTENVSKLTNTNYPFCLFVACDVGSFDEDILSLTESLQISEHGAIASCGSTVKQPWIPPIKALQEMHNYLFEKCKALEIGTYLKSLTYSEIFYHGIQYLLDQKTDESNVTAYTWTFFGDPATLATLYNLPPMKPNPFIKRKLRHILTSICC